MRLWDKRGKPRGVWKHPCGVTSLAFGPKGKAVTSGDDNHLRIRSSRGKLLAERRVADRVSYSVCSPNGFATVPVEGTKVRLWNWKGEAVATLAGHRSTVDVVAFTPEGDLILTGSQDKTARLWGADGRTRKVIPHDSEVYTGMFLPQGLGFVTACWDGSVHHWDRDGKLRARIQAGEYMVTRVDCTEDGRWLATGCDEGTVRFWPLERGDLIRFAGDRLPRGFTDVERKRYAKLLGE